jgi:PKD repeat protein
MLAMPALFALQSCSSGLAGGDGGGGNPDDAKPVAAVAAYPASGSAPFTADLDGSGCWARDGSDLTYDWDFNGDGTWDLLDGDVTERHTFQDAGTQTVILRVTDGQGNANTATLTVEVSAGSGGGGGEDGEPVVSLRAYPATGQAPHKVTLDASGSWAQDGGALEFEYDYEGDGTYDQTTAENSVEHTYADAGTFHPVVRATDAADKSATATATVTVSAGSGGGSSADPVVTLQVYPVSGPAPLKVTLDSSGSWARDGGALDFEYDFEGDGTYDQTTGQNSVEHTYTQAGSYHPKVRATDSDGNSGTATKDLTVEEGSGGGSDDPVVALNAYPTSGNAPLKVTLDASGSWAKDGSALSYEFDVDGDGDYDATADTYTYEYTYTTAGTFTPQLRVTDSGGHSGTASGPAVTVNAAPANRAPSAALSATPTSGDLPLTVNFSATGSTDPDANIASYLFDFDGDGNFDENNSTGTASHIYTAEGDYTAAVLVRDAAGLEDTATVLIQAGGSGGGGDTGQGPIAIVTATPAAGKPPLSVTFNAGMSLSIGSAIKTFDWDMDNDGTFELLDAGPEQSRSFDSEGTFYITVRVTDYENRSATGQGIAILSNYL